MRKTISILLLLVVLLGLAACHRDQPAAAEATAEPTATPSQDDLAILAASDTDAAASLQSHVPPATSTDLEVDAEAYDKAMDCVNLTIFDLYNAIGKPEQTPVYAPSTIEEGAQDGTLLYKGFTVVTVRTDTEERVHDVYITNGE